MSIARPGLSSPARPGLPAGAAGVTQTAVTLPRNQLGARTTAQAALRDVSLRGEGRGGHRLGWAGTEPPPVLALAGADVVMACRNVPAAERIASRLRAALPAGAGALEVMALDSASLASVRAFTRELAARRPRLHLLVNNAGVMATPLGQTADGFETQMGTNHLGHFLLTSLLLDGLRAGAPARVVVVASQAHRRGSREGVLVTLEGDPALPAAPLPAAGGLRRLQAGEHPLHQGAGPPAGRQRRHALWPAPGRHRHRPDEAHGPRRTDLPRRRPPVPQVGRAGRCHHHLRQHGPRADRGPRRHLPGRLQRGPAPPGGPGRRLAERVWTLSERAVAERS